MPGTDVFVAEMGTYGPGEIARAVPDLPARGLGDHHDRRGAPGADEDPRHDRPGQVRDPRTARRGGPQRGRARAGSGRGPARRHQAGDPVLGRERGRRRRRRTPATTAKPGGCSSWPAPSTRSRCPARSATRSTWPSPSAWRWRSTYRRRRSWTGSPPCRARRTGPRSTRTPDGLTVVDDTYNANPEGAAQALDAARGTGRRTVGRSGRSRPGWWSSARSRPSATPSSPGPPPPPRTCGCASSATPTGPRCGRETPARTQLHPDRESAKSHVLAAARAGDVVLYENDLPDHYP